MVEQGWAISARRQGSLLSAATKADRSKEAVIIFDIMQKGGVKLNRHAYHDIIYCHMKDRRLGKACQMLKEMVDVGHVPLDTTCHFLVAACMKRGWKDQAAQIELELRKAKMGAGMQVSDPSADCSWAAADKWSHGLEF